MEKVKNTPETKVGPGIRVRTAANKIDITVTFKYSLHIFCYHKSSSGVKIRYYTENQLPAYPWSGWKATGTTDGPG